MSPAEAFEPLRILMAKLHRFRLGGEVSEVQWRDIEDIVRGCADTLDRSYLKIGAARLDIADVFDRILNPRSQNQT
jgi:hypothetical protein